jgi:hypothetical protein
MRLPRHAEIWLLPYLKYRIKQLTAAPPQRVWVAITDHFEPYWHNADDAVAIERVQLWRKAWPEIARSHRDSVGNPAQYCFFYPQEEYRPHLIDPLAGMVHDGVGDVEVHIHHHADGEAAWLEKMQGFTAVLYERHGLLRKNAGGPPLFGFIHGNWALDNARPDGMYCGLNNEITLLARIGCYADFTMPCGPGPCQSHKLNSIYWAKDDPARPKSYDTGIDVVPGGPVAGDLLMIQGPFGVYLRHGLRHGRWRPSIEIGELSAANPVTPQRVQVWMEAAPRIGSDLFLKLFSHGTQERNCGVLLNGGLAELFTELQQQCSRMGAELRFVTAWQMYQAAEALRLRTALPQTNATTGRGSRA